MGKNFRTTKRLFACAFLFVMALCASATGQEGDVIMIDGERWNLLGKPIDHDSVLYHRLLEVLPKDRSINTANWDGYRGYWNIKDNRLCLDHIEIERYDKDKKRSHVENIPAADIRKVFGKYYQQKEIVATWFTAEIRAAKGNTLYYVHSGYYRNLEYEQLLTIQKGKVTNRQTYHNRVVLSYGFSLSDIKDEAEIKRLFPLHTQNYPELAGVKRILITISNIRLDARGNLVDCDVRVTPLGQTNKKKENIQGLAQEMKTLLKKIRPWKTLYINGEYVSTFNHDSTSFAYELEQPKPASAEEECFDKDYFEEMPEFPGGIDKMLQFIAENVRVPKCVTYASVEGRSIIEMVVEKDGTLSDFKVVRSLHKDCDAEAIRVLKLMPKWKPGKVCGKPIRVKYTVPVQFRKPVSQK